MSDEDSFFKSIDDAVESVNNWSDWKKEAMGMDIDKGTDFGVWWDKNWGKNIQKNSNLKNACRYAFTDAQLPLNKLQEENKRLRELALLILENNPVDNITSQDKNKMFSWQMGILVKAKQILEEIK